MNKELERLIRKKVSELIRERRRHMEEERSVVYEVNESNFEEEVIKKSMKKPVIVDFWAKWCGPCLMLAPILEKVVKEMRGRVYLAKLNVDENPRLTAKFRVTSIPYVALFKKGRLVDEFIGVMPEAYVKKWIEKNTS